jgi:hypothetical protein
MADRVCKRKLVLFFRVLFGCVISGAKQGLAKVQLMVHFGFVFGFGF